GGLINKNLVAQLQEHQCNAIGMSGADGNAIRTTKRPIANGVDFGYVGDIQADSINTDTISKLLNCGFIPVFSAITHNGGGQLLNTNADTIASALATALAELFSIDLVYCFEKKGVLKDVDDPLSVIPEINAVTFEELKENKVVADGMIPKI